MPSTPSSTPEPETPDIASHRRPPSPRAIAAVALVSLVVPALLLVLVLRGGDDGDDGSSTPATSAGTAINAAKVGHPAPPFTLESLGGEQISLSDYRGRPVLLTFWASWCVPCRKEAPVLRQALQERPGEFDVLGVAYEDLERDSRAFLEETGATWPSLVDQGGKVARAYGVVGIPQTFFIDADGVVRDRVFGITTSDALAEPLDELLAG